DVGGGREGRLTAEAKAHGGGFGKVASGDVMIDLLPFLVGEDGPGRQVHAPEARELAFAVLVVGERRLVDQQNVAGRAVDGLEQFKLAVGREVMNRKPAPSRVGRLGAALNGLHEVAMVEVNN